MKLAEALLLRSDLQKKIAQITQRIRPNMIVIEGKPPQESPVKMMEQLRKTIADLQAIVIRINKTNVSTNLNDGRTLMEGLAERDSLKSWLEQLRVIRQSAQLNDQSSYMNRRSVIEIKKIQAEIDQTGRAFRLLDTQIQGLNWTTELRD